MNLFAFRVRIFSMQASPVVLRSGRYWRGIDRKSEVRRRLSGWGAILGTILMLVFGITGGAKAQVVALGASNTAGNGVDSQNAFPAQLEGMLLAKGLSVHVTNAGISGDTNEGMLNRLASSVPEGTKVVILDRGGFFNAMRRTGDYQAAQFQSIVAQLRSRHIKVIMAPQATERQADGIHYTAEGHRRIAASLVGPVAQALRSSR